MANKTASPRTIHTADLACMSISKHSGGKVVVACATGPDDALFGGANGAPGHLTFSISNPKGVDLFKLDTSYRLVIEEVGPTADVASPAAR